MVLVYMKIDKQLLKAFGFQILFATIVFTAFLFYFPAFIQDATVLRDEFQEYQRNIPQIDPYANEEVEILDQQLQDINDVVTARNNLLINSSILFVVLLLASSVVFTFQRKLFDKKQNTKKVFVILLLTQIGLFIFIFIFLFIMSLLAASFGLIENDTSFYISFILLGAIYSYVFVLFYVQKKKDIRKILRIHTIFVIIGLLYMFISSKILTSLENGSISQGLLLLLLLIVGYFIAAYEKKMLFGK